MLAVCVEGCSLGPSVAPFLGILLILCILSNLTDTSELPSFV
jgi:hypothetical protein